MELKTRFYLVDGEGRKFMGIGVLWLLEKTDELGSLRKAAKDMTISYTKAYNMVKRLEEAIGREVLERHKGGSSRDGASLTPFGLRLVRLYRTFQEEARERVEEPYRRFLEELEKNTEEN